MAAWLHLFLLISLLAAVAGASLLPTLVRIGKERGELVFFLLVGLPLLAIAVLSTKLTSYMTDSIVALIGTPAYETPPVKQVLEQTYLAYELVAFLPLVVLCAYLWMGIRILIRTYLIKEPFPWYVDIVGGLVSFSLYSVILMWPGYPLFQVVGLDFTQVFPALARNSFLATILNVIPPVLASVGLPALLAWLEVLASRSWVRKRGAVEA